MSLASRLLLLTERIAQEFKAVRNRLVIAKAFTDGVSNLGEEALDVSIADDAGYLARFRNGTGMEFKLDLTDDGGVRFIVGADGSNNRYLEFYGLNTVGTNRTIENVAFITDFLNVSNLTNTSVSTFQTIKSTKQPVSNDDLTRKDYVDRLFDSKLLFRAFTDCGAAVNTPDFTHAISGTGAAFSNVANGAHNTRFFGVLSLALGTVATNRGAIHSPNLAVVNFLDVVLRPWISRVRLTHRTPSDATNRYTIRIGFLDSVTGEPVDGCYWRYTDNVNGGLWQCVCRSNNTETLANTTQDYVTNQHYEYIVLVEDVAGTRTAKFYRRVIGNATLTVIATITGNIPSGVGRDTGYGISVIRSLGTAAITPLEIDSVEARCEIAATGAWR
jgi:hypothetical protein